MTFDRMTLSLADGQASQNMSQLQQLQQSTNQSINQSLNQVNLRNQISNAVSQNQAMLMNFNMEQMQMSGNNQSINQSTNQPPANPSNHAVNSMSSKLRPPAINVSMNQLQPAPPSDSPLTPWSPFSPNTDSFSPITPISPVTPIARYPTQAEPMFSLNKPVQGFNGFALPNNPSNTLQMPNLMNMPQNRSALETYLMHQHQAQQQLQQAQAAQHSLQQQQQQHAIHQLRHASSSPSIQTPSHAIQMTDPNIAPAFRNPFTCVPPPLMYPLLNINSNSVPITPSNGPLSMSSVMTDGPRSGSASVGISPSNAASKKRKHHQTIKEHTSEDDDSGDDHDDGDGQIHSCPFNNCKKSFFKPSALKRHVRTHTGERPYVCNVQNCGLSFAERGNLKRHERVHTGLKPYRCNLCKHDFARRCHLNQHLKAKHAQPGEVHLGDALTTALAVSL